jgi:PAS domain-containing protein
MPPHRLARMNYPVRVGSFGFVFAVIVIVLMDRAFSVPVLVLAALSFLAYPHLAFLHTRLVLHSKRAEMNNLIVDSAVLGLWVAQIQYAIWPGLCALIALNLNNAICGGPRHLVLGLLAYLSAAALWGAAWGLPFRPDAGMAVAGLCFIGIAGYVSALGLVFHRANRKLVEARETLARSERQFRFIAEQSGSLVAIIDADLRLRYRSAPHVEYFNPNRVEPEADWLGLVHAADRPRAVQFLRYVMQSEGRDSLRLRMESSSGALLPMECNASFLSNEFGGDSRMLLLSCRRLDETERGAAGEQGVTAPGSAGPASLDLDALVISDAFGRTEYADAGYTRLTGFTTQQVVGHLSHDLRSAIGTEDLFGQVARSMGRDGQWQGRCLERRSDGSVFLAGVRVIGVGAQLEAITRLVWLITDLSRLPANAADAAVQSGGIVKVQATAVAPTDVAMLLGSAPDVDAVSILPPVPAAPSPLPATAATPAAAPDPADPIFR